MSNTLQRLKDAQLAARKARDTVRAMLLTTIIGEAVMVGKSAGNRESTDAEVIQVLKKFEKNLNENIRIYGDRRMAEEVDVAWKEITIVREFLPAKLTDLQVQKDIGTTMQKLNIVKVVQKDQGAIVKELREKYGDQFDGAQVSKIFKEMLV